MPTDKRQRQKAGRAVRTEVARKEASRRDNIRRLKRFGFFVGTVLAVLLIAGILQRVGQGRLPAGYQQFREQPTACGGKTPDPVVVQGFSAPQHQSDIGPTASPLARLQTSCGEVLIRLDPTSSPKTVESFVFLARSGFYDGTAFHRLSKRFKIQGGDQQADGQGGPGYVVPDEFPTSDFIYARGVVAMDNRGRTTTGSQFFIVITDDAKLAPTFNVLGTVEGSQQALAGIAAVPVAGETPLETIYLESVVIEVAG